MTTGLETLCVLLADDNPNMREIVSVLLQNVGIKKILTARDGTHALERMKDLEPDIAIIDFKMDPMDGIEFTRIVRTSQRIRNPYLPILMMTGHSAMARICEARDAGVTECIAKPVNARVLLERVSAVITHPRPFVRVTGYFGPDRRRRDDLNYLGPKRRVTDR